MCSGHSKCIGDLCVRLPHAGHGLVGHRFSSRPTSSQRVQIVFSISGQLFLLCPFGSNVPLHFVHLCSGHSKLLAFRWSELPHASHTALQGQLCLLCPFGSSAPLHCEHLCSGHAKLLEFRWSELPHALHRGLHSRAEWPVSPHVLHTRYGHEPLCWRCPGCAHIVQ